MDSIDRRDGYRLERPTDTGMKSSSSRTADPWSGGAPMLPDTTAFCSRLLVWIAASAEPANRSDIRISWTGSMLKRFPCTIRLCRKGPLDDEQAGSPQGKSLETENAAGHFG